MAADQGGRRSARRFQPRAMTPRCSAGVRCDGSPRTRTRNGKATERNRTRARSGRTRKRTEPTFIEPMQAKPVVGMPPGEKWTFEIKFDGYRCVAVKRGSDVTLFSKQENF